MAATPAQREALTRAYRLQVRAVRARVMALTGAAWLGLGSWRDSDVDRFVQFVVPIVTGGQMSVASLTNAYLARYRQMVLGGPFLPTRFDSASVTGAASRNGVALAEVYRRAGKQTWRALASGLDLEAAVTRGHDRAVEAAATDLQRTKLLTDQRIADRDSERTGSMRVLEGASSCGLCVLASTQRYSKTQLQPLHPACDCSVEPLYGIHPEQVLDAARLEQLHAQAAEFFGVDDGRGISAGSHRERRELDYRDLVVVHEHGELGPVLARKGQHFTGPNDI